LVLATLAVGGLVGVLLLGRHIRSGSAAGMSARATESHGVDAVRPRKMDDQTLAVPAEVAKTLGLRTVEVVGNSPPRDMTPLNGVLALDTNRLARIHTRFGGELVALGTVLGGETLIPDRDASADRPLRPGDAVKKGQVLAVIWSKDLGEKKSELVDAVSRLKLDQTVLERLRSAQASIPERSIWEAERAVEADLVSVARIERTLHSWRLKEDEIAAIRSEAIGLKAGTSPNGLQEQWARVEVVSPQDGVILEKNIALGDIVDTTADLFKIADLSELVVWAYCYEEELPTYEKLPRPVAWTVLLPSRPDVAFRGRLEQIGAVIDPTQHTALVSGRVDNRAGELKVGQFVTVTVQVRAPENEIAVPTTALVEDGRSSMVFVQPAKDRDLYVCRKVSVGRRFHDVVYLRSGAGLAPGERIVTSGAVLLKGALEDLPVAE